MIVRIATEGQYRLADAALQKLTELDDRLVTLILAKDEAAFKQVLNEMLDTVEREGQPLSDDELLPSDVILPPHDITLEEAEEMIGEEGLIPG